MIAFTGPLLLAQSHPFPPEFAYAAIAAQNIAFFDIRGDYRLRLSVLALAIVVLAFTATLGAASGGGLAFAVLATALWIAIFAGITLSPATTTKGAAWTPIRSSC